jgi:hypothetical protein
MQGCASTIMSQQLQAGKVAFADANFKKAFHELLPVAAYGNPQAQYAVGYMYYYGFGVPHDAESGLFWMNRSAAQHYGPAIKALEVIRRGVPVCELDAAREKVYATTYKDEHVTCDPGRTWSNKPAPVVKAPEVPCHEPLASQRSVSYPQSEVRLSPLSELNTPPSVSVPHTPSVVAEAKPYIPLPKASLPRIAQNNADAYALQVYGAFRLAHVKSVQNELGLSKETRVWRTKNQTKDWYVLTYGSYPSIADARLARDTLPPQVNDLEPWVRRLDRLEQA